MQLGQVSAVLRHAGAFGNKLVRGLETPKSKKSQPSAAPTLGLMYIL